MNAALKKIEWTPERLLGLFKTLPLLERFPESLMARLVEASEVVFVPPDGEILRQGQLNENLFFLVEGTVGIYVDGGQVSKLNRSGDLLGEMSVISNKETGATILAESPVTVLRVNVRHFLEIEESRRDLALSHIYRIYATVLAEKLTQTNHKAKHFELLNLRLQVAQTELERANETLEAKVEERTQRLEQQNTELMASKNKMEEVLNGRRVVFQKLSEFESKNLLPLKSVLDDVRKRFPDEGVINEARDKVFEVQQILGPLTEQYSSELAVQGKRVLLADSQKKQQVIAKLALGGTGVVLDIVSTLEEGRRLLGERAYDLVCIDTTMLELGNELRERNSRAELVLMTSDTVPTYLGPLRNLSSIPHIVSRDESDRVFTVKNIVTTVTKVLSKDMFGLEKYLSWGIDIQSRPIVGSRQRVTLLETVGQYFEALGVRRANRDRIHNVLEEMLMNAVYDAPADAHGKALYNHMERTQDLSLKPEEQGLVRFATDGMLVAVSVQDPFGALKGGTILRYLEKNYAGEAATAHGSEKKGGAGRGLHQIIENSDLVVFNIDPGRKTEVIALFNVEVKERVHQNSFFPSVHPGLEFARGGGSGLGLLPQRK